MNRGWICLRDSLVTLACIAVFACASRAQVTTWQYDNSRTGANTHESALTPASVGGHGFGKVFSFRVEGDVYAQPLWLPNIDIPGKGRHNVLFVVTEHDSVYAFDADGKQTTPLWQASFTKNSGVGTIPARDVDCPFIYPEVGITPTPVIDYPTGTLYVLARTKEGTGGFSSRYVQRLHALAITNGVEKFGGPVEIKASVSGTVTGEPGRRLDFDPLRENPRAALLLANGKVWLTWASSCDVGPYQGWVIAYDAHTLRLAGVLNVSPDGHQSGIWGGDAGPAADGAGNVYLATGNGKFTAAAHGRDYGDSLLKLSLEAGGLTVRDYFTPFNQRELNANDDDLGSGNPVLLPDEAGVHRHLLAVAGKGGSLYILDRDRLGGFQVSDDNAAVEVIRIGTPSFGAPAYWNGHLFALLSDDVLRDFVLRQGQFDQGPKGTIRFRAPGATPMVSANGGKDGIVWVVAARGWEQPERPAVLYAFDAADVARELWDSDLAGDRDRAAPGVRFEAPMVVNGRVYLAGHGRVDVYGLR